MTLSASEAKTLNYSQFFEGLRVLHANPVIIQSIHELQKQTETLLAGSIEQEQAWRAKLKYMAGLRAGWTAEDALVQGKSIRIAEELLTELDRFMNTTSVEFEACSSGFLSLYWFDGPNKYKVDINSEDSYNIIKSSAFGTKPKTHLALSKNAVLKKILKWSTPGK